MGSKEDESMGPGSLCLFLFYSGPGRTERKEKVYGQLFWFSGWQGLWVSRACLLELGANVKQLSEGREVRRSWTVRSTGDGDWRKATTGVLL